MVPDADVSVAIEQTLVSYACWQLGGPNDHLKRALALAAPSFASQSRLENAFDVSPFNDRLLAALRYIADDPAWVAIARRTLAKLGPRAAETLLRVAVDRRLLRRRIRRARGLHPDARRLARALALETP